MSRQTVYQTMKKYGSPHHKQLKSCSDIISLAWPDLRLTAERYDIISQNRARTVKTALC